MSWKRSHAEILGWLANAHLSYGCHLRSHQKPGIGFLIRGIPRRLEYGLIRSSRACTTLDFSGVPAQTDKVTSSDERLVEAAGVEPASEIHVSKETPCVVDSEGFALRAQNRQDARSTSPMISPLGLGPRPRGQPAVRRSFATHRQSCGERLLN
jgi:hypothetical protein